MLILMAMAITRKIGLDGRLPLILSLLQIRADGSTSLRTQTMIWRSATATTKKMQKPKPMRSRTKAMEQKAIRLAMKMKVRIKEMMLQTTKKPHSSSITLKALQRQKYVGCFFFRRIGYLDIEQILTPADFALLTELRAKASKSTSGAKRKRIEKGSLPTNDGEAVFLGEADILGQRKKAKATYEERMASIQEGREGREKFGSSKGKRRKENPSSTTNREKKRNKPLMMVMASNAVRGKKKASLMEKQRRMRRHNENQKKQKRR